MPFATAFAAACHRTAVAVPLRGASRLSALALAAKVALAACLVHAVAYSDLPQYQDKAMGSRLVAYPLIAVAVPVASWVHRRRRTACGGYPWLVDLCATLPFLFDSAGNAWHLYDRIERWDDLMHVATWVPWVVAFGLLVAPRIDDRLVLAGVIVGFGAVTHIGWEIGEYLTFVQHNPAESLEAYRDTMGDMALSLLGSVTGAALVATTRPGPSERVGAVA